MWGGGVSVQTPLHWSSQAALGAVSPGLSSQVPGHPQQGQEVLNLKHLHSFHVSS